MMRYSVLFTAGLLLAAIGTARADDAVTGNAASGEKVFVACRACHQIGPTAKNFIGPVLNGVVGRHAGIYPGYTYSAANKNSGITWDVATLKIYLKNPRARVPGTKMTFPGLRKDTDIDNVIAYLKSFDKDGKKT